MDIRSILVLVGAEPRSMPSLDVAIDVGHLTDARITGLRVPFWREESWFIDVPQELPEPPAAPLPADIEQTFIARCSGAGRPCDWVSDHGAPAERLAFHSRYADLVVVARDGLSADNGALPVAELGRLALMAASPILAVPPEPLRSFQARRILVAWNERREAARAARNALPLLRRAKDVVLLSVHPPGYDDTPDRRIVDYLALHHVHAEARINFAAEFEAAGAILAQAHAMDADLLVMGAYGHSRAFESVLGGVTRYMLEHADRPVMLSH